MPIDTQALADDILRAGREDISEATLRIRIEHILNNYLATIGISYQPMHERRTVTTGKRTDALFGTVIIEYKRPNRLATPAQWKETTEQLKGYIADEATRTGVSIDRYAGILIDGKNIGFIRHVEDGWSIVGPEAIHAQTIGLALEYLRGLSRKPLDPELLNNDFGPQSELARASIIAFWNALQTPSPKTDMLYQEWKQLFGQISGYSSAQLPEMMEMESDYGLDANHDMPRLLFTVHTYYAFLIKLLAAEILTLVRRGIGDSFLEKLSILNTHELKNTLVTME